MFLKCTRGRPEGKSAPWRCRRLSFPSCTGSGEPQCGWFKSYAIGRCRERRLEHLAGNGLELVPSICLRGLMPGGRLAECTHTATWNLGLWSCCHATGEVGRWIGAPSSSSSGQLLFSLVIGYASGWRFGGSEPPPPRPFQLRRRPQQCLRPLHQLRLRACTDDTSTGSPSAVISLHFPNRDELVRQAMAPVLPVLEELGLKGGGDAFEAEDFLRDDDSIFGKLEIMIGMEIIRGYGVRVLMHRPYKLTLPTENQRRPIIEAQIRNLDLLLKRLRNDFRPERRRYIRAVWEEASKLNIEATLQE